MNEPSDTDQPSANIPAFAFIALSLAAFGSGISQRVTDPLLPRLASEFFVSIGMASLAVTVFTIGYGLNQLFFGPVGDRFGKYRVIAWAAVACALGSLMCALSSGFNMLLIARLITGSMAAAIIPLSMAWIGDVVPYENRQPVLARFLIGQILGVSAGQLLGGLAADFLGWRVPFFLLAFGFLAVSLLLFSIQKTLPLHGLQRASSTGHVFQRLVHEFAEVFKLPWARVVIITVFLEGAFVFGPFAFFAVHLYNAHNLSLSAAGAVVMLFGAGGFLFASGSSAFVRRLGEAGLARWGGFAISAAMMVFSVAPHWWWTIPASFVTGLGFYMLHNTLQTNATQMAPERRGAAVSAFAACYFIGQSTGLATAGVATAFFGTRLVIIVGAIGVLLVALNFARLKLRVVDAMHT
jgi:predicted MFS family arabinose efflux permease